MEDIFICEICQQELDLSEQSFDLEGACENCAKEAQAEEFFKCCCCANTFPKEECGSCDDICQECDEDVKKD